MADSRPDPTRFKARGPTRVGPLPPRAGRASKGQSMTSGLAAMSWSGRGRVVAGYWNARSRRRAGIHFTLEVLRAVQPDDALDLSYLENERASNGFDFR